MLQRRINGAVSSHGVPSKMGRRGMKGFIKSAAKKPGDDEEEEEHQEEDQPKQGNHNPAQAQQQRASKPAAKSDDAGSDDGDSGNTGDGGDGPETRGQMLQRHKREMLAHKKALQRSGKKSKDEVVKLTTDIEKRHAEELRQLEAGAISKVAASGAGGAAAETADGGTAVAGGGTGAAAGASGAGVAGDALSKYMKGLSMDSKEAAAQGRKPSKAQKRREKHAVRDAERDARIAAEKEALGTPERLAEESELKALLAPLDLGIKDIRADGHCMYRSIEDQLRTTAKANKGGQEGSDDEDDEDDANDVPSYQELRELAAGHLRAHRDEFSPYLVPEDEGQDPVAYYDRYCDNIEITATWGGHIELQALAGALKRRITVYGVGMQPQTVGEEFAGEGPTLTLCFLRHAFGLGEHYNSTRKLLFAPGAIAAAAAEEQLGGEAEE